MRAREPVETSPAGEDLGFELLPSVREMKARKFTRATQVQPNAIVEARQSAGLWLDRRDIGGPAKIGGRECWPIRMRQLKLRHQPAVAMLCVTLAL